MYVPQTSTQISQCCQTPTPTNPTSNALRWKHHTPLSGVGTHSAQGEAVSGPLICLLEAYCSPEQLLQGTEAHETGVGVRRRRRHTRSVSTLLRRSWAGSGPPDTPNTYWEPIRAQAQL